MLLSYSVYYRKNEIETIDELVYIIRECAVDGPCSLHDGLYCRECDKNKEELLTCFAGLFTKLTNNLCNYQSHKEDFNHNLQVRFLELIYEWDDTVGIYFTKFINIMLGRVALKQNQKLREANRRREQEFQRFNAKLMQKNDMRFDKGIENVVSDEMFDFMLSQLTEKQRNVVKERFKDKALVNELAAKHQVSPGAISNLLKRAYTTLRSTYESVGDNEDNLFDEFEV